MNITNDTEKIAIIERLVKDGAIDFREALKLMVEPMQVWQWPIVFPEYPIQPYYEHITSISEIIISN